MSSYTDLDCNAEYAFPCVDGLAKGYVNESFNERNFWGLKPTSVLADIESGELENVAQTLEEKTKMTEDKLIQEYIE